MEEFNQKPENQPISEPSAHEEAVSSDIEDDEEEDVEDQIEDATDRLDVLINLLVKKGLITEEELQADLDAWLAEKEADEGEE